MTANSPHDGPKIGDNVDGQILVAVGINDTFTEVLDNHREAFTLLNEWMNGLRLYGLEETFEIDANFWDELLDCDYVVGEGEIEGETPDDAMIVVFDAWVEAETAEDCLDKVITRLEELKTIAREILPPGLQAAASLHTSPTETLKLIAQLSE